MFTDIRHDCLLILLSSLTDPDMLKQSKLTYHEINRIKNLALENIHRQRKIKEYTAVSFIGQYFLFEK